MNHRHHLILSDIHENLEGVRHFLEKTEKTCPDGFDVWLLGDLFGHPDQSRGHNEFNESFASDLELLQRYQPKGVFGNWEYWLSDPASDLNSSARMRYIRDLEKRRIFLESRTNPLYEQLIAHEITFLPDDTNAVFTLFHGCSYACHQTLEYPVAACECYLYPKDLNIVTSGLFGEPGNLPTRHFLFGHTHLPGYFVYAEKTGVALWIQFTPSITDRIIKYENGFQRFGINPGSAGIADGILPRTAVLLDTEENTFRFITDEISG